MEVSCWPPSSAKRPATEVTSASMSSWVALRTLTVVMPADASDLDKSCKAACRRHEDLPAWVIGKVRTHICPGGSREATRSHIGMTERRSSLPTTRLECAEPNRHLAAQPGASRHESARCWCDHEPDGGSNGLMTRTPPRARFGGVAGDHGPTARPG